MSYSWYNIDASFGNNKIRWRKKGEGWKTLTFPNGMYDYSGINTFLQAQTGKVDPKDEDSKCIFTLYVDMTIFPVVILMDGDYELDLSGNDFAELLGYEKKVLTGQKNFVGEMVPNITRGVDCVFLHCNLISRRANDVASDVLYSFSTAGLHVSYPFQKEPYRLEWHPVKNTESYAIKIWVTAGRNNLLDLNGIDVAVSIIIEKE